MLACSMTMDTWKGLYWALFLAISTMSPLDRHDDGGFRIHDAGMQFRGCMIRASGGSLETGTASCKPPFLQALKSRVDVGRVPCRRLRPNVYSMGLTTWLDGGEQRENMGRTSASNVEEDGSCWQSNKGDIGLKFGVAMICAWRPSRRLPE